MAYLSTILSISKPTGMWESIIWGFESFTNNYVWAVVLLTVIIRVIWSPLDTYNRHISTKNAKIQAEMQPELQKIQEKYANDRQLLNQKTNEVYKKHNANMMGSCGFMIVFMVLNLVIFFTLFSGLNNIASYKIYDNYENLKVNYANCLNVANENHAVYIDAYNNNKDLEFRVFTDIENDTEVKYLGLFEKSTEGTDKTTALTYQKYLTIQEFKELDNIDEENDSKRENDTINKIIENLNSKVLIEEEKDENEEIIKQKVTLLDRVTITSMSIIETEYLDTQEKFLWIQNIWIADSPFQTSIFDYNGFASMVGAGNLQKNEDKIYNAFMPSLTKSQSKVNGYFILPVLCILVSYLSAWLSQRLMRDKNKPQAKQQGKLMQIIMPLVMGVFAILYNAVFAVYMFTSQAISTALLPLQQVIVKKLENKADKKKQQKIDSQVDYRRKF